MRQWKKYLGIGLSAAMLIAAVQPTQMQNVLAEESVRDEEIGQTVSGNETDLIDDYLSGAVEEQDKIIISESEPETVTAEAKSFLTAGSEDTNIASGHVDNGTEQGVDWVIDAEGKLTVTGTGDFKQPSGYPIWYDYRDRINSAVVDLKETTDASGMFNGCGYLESIDLSRFDTSSVIYMNSMFYGCSRLSELDVSKFDTSNVKDMSSMFSRCSNLSKLDLSKFDTSNVKKMIEMFYICSNLSELDVSGFDTGNVEDMYGMFYGCSSLSGLDVSGFNTKKVVDMGSMFGGCSSLSKLDLSKFDTSNVKIMGAMFSGCSSINELDVRGFNTSKVIDMGSMFCRCSSLKSLDVRGFDTSKVTDMSSMFSDCSGLKSLDVGGFDTSSVTSMQVMFGNCSSLESLDVSAFDTSNVKDMLDMFRDCGSLESLDVRGFDTSKVTGMSAMFGNCSSLKSLDVSGFDTSNVMSMSGMLSNCSSLKSLDVSGFDTSKVRSMSEMFCGCSSLKELDVSSFNTRNVERMDDMFSYCESLKELDVSGFDTSNVTDMRYMFSYCKDLEELDVRGFDTSKVRKMHYMFCRCSSLKKLDLSGFDTSNLSKDVIGGDSIPYKIVNGMFRGCDSLIMIKTIVQNVSIDLEAIYYDAQGNFYGYMPQNMSESIWLYRSKELIGSEPREYVLSFDANGGVMKEVSKVVTENESYKVLPTPTRVEYVFTGWYTAKEGGEKVTSDTVCKGDATVYAHWKFEKRYIPEYAVTSENVNAVRDEIKAASNDALVEELKDEEAVAALDAIEKTYKEINGIRENAPISTLSDVDAKKIEVTGAALNMDSGEITLKIIPAKNDDTVYPSNYNNNFVFDMSVIAVKADGTIVDFSKELDIPVTVSLPIPEQININRVKLLHKHSDGTMEEVDVKIDKENCTATFTVTHFSLFAFVELAALLGDINGDGDIDAKDRMYLARALAGWDGYTVPGVELADFNGDGEVNAKDRMYLARKLAGWEGYE